MNGQGAENTQGQQSSEKVASPEFPMSDATTMHSFEAGDWMIGFDEDTGDMKIQSTEKTVAPPPAETGIVGGTDSTSGQEGLQGRDGSQQSAEKSPADTRIANLEVAVHKLLGIVAGIAQMPGISNSLNGQGQQQEPERKYDLSDTDQLGHFIVDAVDRSTKAAIKPIIELLPGILTRLEYQDVNLRFGKEATELEPAIKLLMDSDANLTYQVAFSKAKQMKEMFGGKSANSHSTDQPDEQRTKGTADALIAKANALKTEQGVGSGGNNTRPPIKNVRDAFEAAWETETQR